MNMSMYTLILKNEKERTYKRVRFFLVMLNALVILMLIINSPEVFDRLWRPYFILALCALYFFFHIVEFASSSSSKDIYDRTIILWVSLAWLDSKYWWVFIILVVFAVLDFFALRKFFVQVGSKKIVLPTIPRKKMTWTEVDNVILKDGIFTVEMNNNRFFQHEITNAGEYDEKQFNDYCRDRMAKSRVEQQKKSLTNI